MSVVTNQFPKTLIENIRNQKNVSNVIYLSKGSSKYLYVVIYERNEKEVYDIVTYGEENIKDYLKEFYSKSKEELSFSEEGDYKKLLLFIDKLFYDYGLKKIEIDGEEMSLEDDIEEFLKSISEK